MNDVSISITNKELKVINDINQVVKKSFLHYFITDKGLIFTDVNGACIDNGFHFSYIHNIDKLLEIIPIPDDELLVFYSQDLFNAIKENKKIINSIKILNNKVYLVTDKDSFLVGQYAKFDEGLKEIYRKAFTYTLKLDPQCKLPDELIKSLVENEIITYRQGEYKIRITKTLFPHIKVGLPINISFVDLNENDLFETIINITKDNVTNFHVYKCIKF
jgi:hypothetical protein